MRQELAKLLLIGSYGIKFVQKADLQNMHIFKTIEYIRDHIKQISMQQLGLIMKGLSLVYHLQLINLEKDTKNLLSLLNGDHLWNNYLKKQLLDDKSRKNKNGKKSGPKIQNDNYKRRGVNDGMNQNMMDIRLMLRYTRDRLDFYSSQHSEKALLYQDDKNGFVKDRLGNGEQRGQQFDHIENQPAFDIYNMDNPDGYDYDQVMNEQLQIYMQQQSIGEGLNSSGQKSAMNFGLSNIVNNFLMSDDQGLQTNMKIKLNEALSQDFLSSAFKEGNMMIQEQENDIFFDAEQLICSDHSLEKPNKKGASILKNKKFQEYLLGYDAKTVQKKKNELNPEDIIFAQTQMILNQINFKSQKKNKNDVFDDFICDLLSTKVDIASGLENSMAFMNSSNSASFLPLDQTLVISTAKKHQIQNLLQNLSGSKSNEMTELRGQMLRDLSSINHGSSSSNNLNGIEPLRLNFNEFDNENMNGDLFGGQFLDVQGGDDDLLRMGGQDNHNMSEMMGDMNQISMSMDFPSLRDLETSNMFSRVHHNYNIQKHMTQKRLQFLDKINSDLEKSSQEFLLFEEIALKKSTKSQAVEAFMSLLVFQQAGFCELRQSRMRDSFSISTFAAIKVYKR
eukprot:403350758